MSSSKPKGNDKMNAKEALKRMYDKEYNEAINSIDDAIRYRRYNTILRDNSSYSTLKELGIIRELEYKGFICYPDIYDKCLVSWNPKDIKERRRESISFLSKCFSEILKLGDKITNESKKDSR